MSTSNGSDLLSYRITRRFESEMLDNDVVENNLYEADRIHNTQYIMSAGTAWLRAHPGKTIADLDDKFDELGIETIILATPYKESTEFELCVPGNQYAMPIYAATFIHGMRLHKSEFITKFYSTTPEENRAKLPLAGYSCPKGQAYDVATGKPPNINSLKQVSILTQLQWASISIMVEMFDTEKTYTDEIEKITREYSRTPYKYRTYINDNIIDFLIMPDDGSINIVSEFGTTEKDGKSIAIHVRTFVRNLYRDKVGNETTITIAEFDKMANIAISKTLEKFDPERLVDASEHDKKAIVSYLEANRKRNAAAGGQELQELQAAIQKHIAEQAEQAIKAAQMHPGATTNTTINIGGGMTMTSSTTSSTTTHTTQTNQPTSGRTTVRKNPNKQDKTAKEVTADDIQRKLAEIAERKKNLE